MPRRRCFLALLLALGLLLPAGAGAQADVPPPTEAAADEGVRTSHRLIVELNTPPLTRWLGQAAGGAAGAAGLRSAAAQAYVEALASEQDAFARALPAALPGAAVSTYLNAQGQAVEARYRLALNGLAIDPGTADRDAARRALARMPGVRAVYLDYAYSPTLYASTGLIGAPAAWEAAGGRAHAGEGVRVASMDGGLHKDAPMFSGQGYAYPPGYPRGLAANTNGKIIASRVYFRPWDPPVAEDANPWPGPGATSHGVHTASIAAGGVVTATYLGSTYPNMSGVAPRAYLMSYRMFYQSVSGDGSFYTAEGLAALEDIIADGADVLNNSWGGGPASLGGEFDALDAALQNAARAGIVVSMSAGNAGPGPGTTDHPSPDYITVAASASATQLGQEVDVVAAFSSRGPGVGPVLKPDIAAPGVSILAQGYAPYAYGEERHLLWGLASGTSMAAPHVAGAAALLRQMHPSWSPAQIKSALMSTAKYLDVYTQDGRPAQPLDMGAGRLDVAAALDPGVLLDPPSLSIGQVITGSVRAVAFTVTNVGQAAAAYALATRSTAEGFAGAPPVPGLSVAPAALSLEVGESAVVTVTFDASASAGLGDNQGYVVLQGGAHQAHLPAWARVTPEPSDHVLVIDADGSGPWGLADYAPQYAAALAQAGLPHTLWDADAHRGGDRTIPPAAELAAYRAVLLFTGDNRSPSAALSPPGALTPLDLGALCEYANQGGVLLAMGQNLAAVLGSASAEGGAFLYSTVLGGRYLQDSVTAGALPTLPVVPIRGAPTAFRTIYLDLAGEGSYGGSVSLTADEVAVGRLYLALVHGAGGAGAAEAGVLGSPGGLTGVAHLGLDVSSARLDYALVLSASAPAEVSSVALHRGAPGENGPALRVLLSGPLTVSTPTTACGEVLLSAGEVRDLLAGDLYLAVHGPGEVGGAGLLRGQIVLSPGGEGAGNQRSIDEIAAVPFRDAPPGYLPLLHYPGPDAVAEGVVAMAHRDQPSLERPGVSYLGRSVLATFGLEGLNATPGATTRSGLLSALLAWAEDAPQVTIADVTTANASGWTTLQAGLTSPVPGSYGVSYRWDMGDGTPFLGPFTGRIVGHAYAAPGVYTVRVEATDCWGNVAIGALQVHVGED